MHPQVKLANKLMRAKHYGPAVQVLSQRLHHAPDDGDAVHLHGTALYRIGKNAEAAERFGRLVTLRPNDARAQDSWAAALLRVGRDVDARTALKRALELHPTFEPARRRLQQLDADRATPSTRPPDEDLHLTAGALLGQGHRRLSSFAGEFCAARWLCSWVSRPS